MNFPFFNHARFSDTELFNERTFYGEFLKDLSRAKEKIIIESPFITINRIEIFTPIFQGLVSKGIKIAIITRDPIEHDESIKYHATDAILTCKELGAQITLLKGKHHRKLAIIDNNILWEGSLNILSQSHSKEIMRRIYNPYEVSKMKSFLGY